MWQTVAKGMAMALGVALLAGVSAVDALADRKGSKKTIFNPPPPVPLEIQQKHARPGGATAPRKNVVAPDGTIVDIIILQKHRSGKKGKRPKRAIPTIIAIIE